MENLLKEANDPLLTDSERRQNDAKIKAQLRSITEQVKVPNLSEVMDLANEITCQYEAAYDFEKKVNDSSNFLYVNKLFKN